MRHDPPLLPPDSSPSPTEPFPPGPPAVASGLRRRSGLSWLVALLIALWLVMQVPNEIGRWQLALAVRAQMHGERALAEKHLQAAMRWFPEHPALLVHKAQWQLEAGQREEALATLAQVREVSQDATYWLMVQAYCLQKAGEFAQAVPLWRIIEQRSQTSGIPPRSEALNGLAYAMALADVDLEEALQLAEQALQLSPRSPGTLDTRGYILYRLQRYGEAARDLQRATQLIDRWLAPLENQRQAENLAEQGEPPSALPSAIVELFPTASGRPSDELSQLRQAGAVIHYHLALVFQAVGRQAGAELEMQKARQLAGREPDASLF